MASHWLASHRHDRYCSGDGSLCLLLRLADLWLSCMSPCSSTVVWFSVLHRTYILAHIRRCISTSVTGTTTTTSYQRTSFSTTPVRHTWSAFLLSLHQTEKEQQHRGQANQWPLYRSFRKSLTLSSDQRIHHYARSARLTLLSSLPPSTFKQQFLSEKATWTTKELIPSSSKRLKTHCFLSETQAVTGKSYSEIDAPPAMVWTLCKLYV